jgi:two-component system response regulator AtoC
MSRLVAFNWPGNVRQLENMMKQVVVRGDEMIIAELIASASHQAHPSIFSTGSGTQPTAIVDDSPPGEENYSLKSRVSSTIAAEEKRIISEVLAKTNWNRRKAAEMLQISYRSLLYKIKDYELNASA